ncbi:arginine deiminase family protein [Mycobacterium sp. AMU20-3851]|uniref:arginine deiminase family protein n=1 Tax=Mycobacterium sp. AMU20-3851 TaxID=3122055 RepID=UPI003754A9D2
MVALGSDSEVGTLRVVILHRPGVELHGLDEVRAATAQQEHDGLAALLRSRGVEVLLLADLLAQALASGAARMHGISAAVDSRRLGVPLAQELSAYLRTLTPADLAHVLMAGMTFAEVPLAADELSLVRRMHHGGDFVIDPLPQLMYTRDSSFWVGPRVVIPSLSLPSRARETSLTDLIYAHHPRFLGVRRAYESRSAPVEGGDVLLPAPGVVAIGVGERTTPAAAEALARSLFDDDLAQTVLAVPVGRMHLDTLCTMVDVDAVVMRPDFVDALSAFTIRRSADGVRIEDEAPFVLAAAEATGVDRLRVIEAGHGGTNILALSPGVVVADERNVQTTARLADSGIEVLTVAGSGTGRGGPRCMTCPAARDPV